MIIGLIVFKYFKCSKRWRSGCILTFGDGFRSTFADMLLLNFLWKGFDGFGLDILTVLLLVFLFPVSKFAKVDHFGLLWHGFKLILLVIFWFDFLFLSIVLCSGIMLMLGVFDFVQDHSKNLFDILDLIIITSVSHVVHARNGGDFKVGNGEFWRIIIQINTEVAEKLVNSFEVLLYSLQFICFANLIEKVCSFQNMDLRNKSAVLKSFTFLLLVNDLLVVFSWFFIIFFHQVEICDTSVGPSEITINFFIRNVTFSIFNFFQFFFTELFRLQEVQ